MKVPFQLSSIKPPLFFLKLTTQLQQQFAKLSMRDQMAVRVLGIALSVFIVLFMLLSSHHYYQKNYSAWQSAQEIQLWMQQVAPSLSTDSAAGGDLNTILSSTAGQQGLTLNVKNSTDPKHVEITVSHPSYSALASWLDRITALGAQVDQLTLKQEPNHTISMAATLSM